MKHQELTQKTSYTDELFNIERTQNSELLLESCLESPKDMIIMAVDQNYRYLYFNQMHAKAMMNAYQADVKIGMNIFDAITSQEDILKSKENYDRALKGESHSTIQSYGDKEIRTYESFYNPIKDTHQNIIGMTAFARDITDRIQSENDLRNNQILISSIINQTTDAIYVKDLLGKYILLNKSAERCIDRKREEIMGKDDYSLFPHKEANLIVKQDRQILNEHQVITIEEYLTCCQKNKEVFLSTKGPLFNQANQVIGTFGISRNITERINNERQLQESEQRFKLLIDVSPDAIFIQVNNKFRFVNKATLKLFGVSHESELIGQNIIDWIHPQYKEVIKRRMYVLNVELKDVPLIEEIFIRKDKSLVNVEVNGAPIIYENQNGSIIFARNIDERKQHEQEQKIWESQHRQQQKLEAIGLLAGGVAHEINNPLNIMMNYAQLILDDTSCSVSSQEYANNIMQDCLRISGIVKNLLQFSRSEKVSYSQENIETIVQNTLSLVNSVIKKDQIEIRVEIEDELPLLMCHAQEIQQVLINLLTNARDALNEKIYQRDGSKVIFIKAIKIIQDQRPYLELSVEDNGTGISLEHMEHLFEPFFSTKDKDKGTGLGLSISFGIIKNHKGSIRCESKENEFTRFIMTLPFDER